MGGGAAVRRLASKFALGCHVTCFLCIRRRMHVHEVVGNPHKQQAGGVADCVVDVMLNSMQISGQLVTSLRACMHTPQAPGLLASAQ